MRAKREESSDYKKIRAKVKRRDKSKCQLCGSKRRIQVHHIIRHCDSILSREEMDNLISLCFSCHKLVTGRESYYAPLLTEIIIHNKKRK